MYVELEEKTIPAIREAGKKEGKDHYGDDWDGQLVWEVNELDETVTLDEIDGLTLSVSAQAETMEKEKKKLIYVSFDVMLDLDDVAKILGEYVKRVNKIKTILEAAK